MIYYSGKYNEVLPWGWYVELAPGTKLTYQNGVIVSWRDLNYFLFYITVWVSSYELESDI